MIGTLLSYAFWVAFFAALWWGVRAPRDPDVESVEQRERALKALTRIGEDRQR